MIECASWHAVACSGEEWAETRGQWGGTTAGRRDKRGSPVEPQAIGMAWVPACQSVEARAAPCVFTNAIKGGLGTVGTAAFFLDAPDLRQVLKLAQEGKTLPQKATYFHPKPPSGMVFDRLERDRRL